MELLHLHCYLFMLYIDEYYGTVFWYHFDWLILILNKDLDT